jgi:hypothetical protein
MTVVSGRFPVTQLGFQKEAELPHVAYKIPPAKNRANLTHLAAVFLHNCCDGFLFAGTYLDR